MCIWQVRKLQVRSGNDVLLTKYSRNGSSYTRQRGLSYEPDRKFQLAHSEAVSRERFRESRVCRKIFWQEFPRSVVSEKKIYIINSDELITLPPSG